MENTLERPRLRVLVVDDDEELLSVTAEVLLGAGFEVETAAGGAEALRLAERRIFDVLLSDVSMPALPGPLLRRALAERDPILARRTVFVTGLTPEEFDGADPLLGPAPVFRKPVLFSELIASIALRWSRREEEERQETG